MLSNKHSLRTLEQQLVILHFEVLESRHCQPQMPMILVGRVRRRVSLLVVRLNNKIAELFTIVVGQETFIESIRAGGIVSKI